VDILPILIDGADPDHCRSLAGEFATAIGRSFCARPDGQASDPRWVAARADVATDSVDGTQVVEIDAGATVADVMDRVHRTEPVDVGHQRSYPVIVGPGARCRLPDVLPPTARRVAIVTQQAVDVEVDPGIEHRVFTVEDGERAKRLDVVGDLASAFARWGLTRNDVVVAVGGGVVTDLGGFAASVYHRGVPVIHVATTLLGQIDAAIGGKCGVNLDEGKNLVGSFWQPAAVLCDTDTLVTLPERDYRSGLGELAKYHFLGGGELDALPLVDRVAACVRIKADVVAEDEREGGRRAILNYGHTLAHALEAAGTYEIRHGEAVATGLVYAAEVAHRLGRIGSTEVEEHRRVVEHYGQSVTVPAGLDAKQVLDLFGRDKKALDGITFVLDGPDGVEPVRVDDHDVLLAALEAMR
jgi:5-deoxy-5-amino-3-dehydroquinate synthase